MSKLPEKIYFTDELNDEFSFAQIKTPFIDGNYRYLRDSFFDKVKHVLCYHIVAKPIAWLYLKLKFHHQIVGKEKIKPFKKQACFFYGNHTQVIADALIPAFLVYPKNIKVIVHPNNLKAPFVGPFVPSLGGLPLPGDMKATRNFIKAIDVLVKRNEFIFIYPEAHLWPYYTKIRPFVDTSFRYPVKYETPTFCFTNTYHKRRNSKKVKIITYVDGPFYPDANLEEKEAKQKLRDEVYQIMCERASTSDKDLIQYVKKEKEND